MTMKPNLVNIFVRIFSLGVLLFFLRFIYTVSFKCHVSNYCFFSTTDQRHQFIPGSLEYDYYSSIFQDYISYAFISRNSSSLSASDIVSLRDLGFPKTASISSKITSRRLPFPDHVFDFEFFSNPRLHSSVRPLDLASEIARTLKPGGILVIHTISQDLYSFHSLLDLFNFCSFVRARDLAGPNSFFPTHREVILMKKTIPSNSKNEKKVSSLQLHDQCSVSGYKRQLIKNAEPLIKNEPLKPWIALKRNLKCVKYLPSMVDISFKPRYVYVDVGARNYGSSIGSWFKKHYPKQNNTFDVYAIEADKAFHGEYRSKRGVTLLPYAAWLRNEILFFEINREPTKMNAVKRGRRGMGRIQPVAQSSTDFMGDVDKITGFDFSEWLKSEFEERDFVVVKMDVEGTEFHLIPRLIETGAICLIDEMFLECHYNRWQRCCPGVRSPKYQNTYAHCLQLFSSLRDRGVLVHQWL